MPKSQNENYVTTSPSRPICRAWTAPPRRSRIAFSYLPDIAPIQRLSMPADKHRSGGVFLFLEIGAEQSLQFVREKDGAALALRTILPIRNGERYGMIYILIRRKQPVGCLRLSDRWWYWIGWRFSRRWNNRDYQFCVFFYLYAFTSMPWRYSSKILVSNF